MTRTSLASALVVLLHAVNAHAVQLHFEAWRTQSSETCPAPCYQMRMFLQVDPWDPQEIQAIQMDIRIGDGAVAAQLPVYPARNDNAGPGNVHVRSDGARNVSVPWDLSSAVAQSPTENFDALMVQAATSAFTVQQLADLVDDPRTSCVDADTCAFVEEALALNRVYLGFMNVTRGPPPFEPGQPEASPIFGSEFKPQGVPYFVVHVGNVTGVGDAVTTLAQYGGGDGFVEFLPEPSPALLLAGALALLVSWRRAG